MANEKRIRQGGIGGLVEDNPLSASATLLTAAGLAAVNGGVDSSHHLAICLDPDGLAGAPEIAYVTALTAGAGATGATGLLRGQEGTTARQHDQDTPWIHGLTPRDFQRVVQTIDTSTSDTTVSSATYADLDATNLPALSLYAYAGDLLEWALTGSFTYSVANNQWALDALITLPDASTTSFRALGSKSAAYLREPESAGNDDGTHRASGLYVATQTGVHSFKPQYKAVGGGTLVLRRSSTYGTNPTHVVKNLGPPAD